jgi:DNA-binding CsgD family transcriptional regulator
MSLSAFVAEDLPDLLDLLYGAALDKGEWPAFLQALLKPFDGANGVLHFFDIPTQSTPVAYNFGVETDYLISYQEHFSSCNPYPVQSFSKLPVLQVRQATDVLSKEDAMRTEFYNDWMRPQGITPDHLGCMLQNDGKEMVLLAIAPGAKSLERKVDLYKKRFELLAPHLKRAIALSKIRRSDPAGGTLPAQFSCAALLISPSRVIKAVNPPAERILKDSLFLSVDPLGRLRVREADSHAAFLAAAEAVFNRREPIGGPVHCKLPFGDNRLSIVVLRLPMTFAEIALVLLIAKPNGSTSLAEVQFTAAESRLAKALLNGQTLADFSDHVGVSINTARKQLAALFAKTGTNRQAALVAWLLQRGF